MWWTARQGRSAGSRRGRRRARGVTVCAAAAVALLGSQFAAADAHSTGPFGGAKAPAAAHSSTVRNGRIAFSTGFIFANPDLSTHSQIFTVKPDGSDVRQLTATPDGVVAGDPVYSPNGARIAYVDNQSGNFAIWLMNADGTGKHPIIGRPGIDYFTPGWSPDGTHLSATRCNTSLGFTEYCDIVVLGADGTGVRTVVGGHRLNQNPDYSPDGRWIAFESDRAGLQGAIWLVRPNGARLHRITPAIVEAGWPRWSPSGAHILFDDNCCRLKTQLFVMRPDGSHVRQLTHFTGNHQGGFPNYSPDGTRIVFISNQRRDAAGPANDLYTMGSDGSGVTRIVGNHPDVAVSDWGPAVAPAGTHVLNGSRR
jgi:Tol biopolymer transport system component